MKQLSDLIMEHFDLPESEASHFHCVNGYDLMYRGYYQSGYSDGLVDSAYRYMCTMSNEVYIVFNCWSNNSDFAKDCILNGIKKS